MKRRRVCTHGARRWIRFAADPIAPERFYLWCPDCSRYVAQLFGFSESEVTRAQLERAGVDARKIPTVEFGTSNADIVALEQHDPQPPRAA